MTSNLYLITGDESFEKKEALEKIKENFGEELVKGINFIILDKDSISSLESEINTYTFGCLKKLILVKFDKKEKKDDKSSDASTEKEDWFNEEMEEILLNLTDVTVIFYGEFQKRSRIYKFVEKSGKVILCEKKKDYEILSWCKKIFDDNSVKIDNADINYLIETVGNEKLVLNNEIEKLVSYAISSKVITREDIDNLCVRNSEVIIFALTDSLGNKNIKRSLELLNELLENKEPIQMITIMIARHFKSLLVAKIATLNNKNVADELNSKSAYSCSKYVNQSKMFSLKEIVRIVKSLSQLDVNSKTGLIDLKIGLESVICG